MTDETTWIDRLYKTSVNWIVDILSLLTLILLICATGLLGYEVYYAIVDWEPGKIRDVAIHIFNVLIFIEVAHLFRQFRHGAGIAIGEVVEISFLVVMRELIVKNAEGTADPLHIFGFAAVLATLSLAWWLVRGGARPGAGAGAGASGRRDAA
jgi:uncharacterized membrane protein (DUF373 family)